MTGIIGGDVGGDSSLFPAEGGSAAARAMKIARREVDESTAFGDPWRARA